MKFNTRKLVLSAMFLALGVLLPIALHAIPNAGSIVSPMHIPVLLCGLVCGWQYGLVVGPLTVLLSSLLTGMPPLGSPYFLSMMPELAAYGLLAGLFTRLLPEGTPGLYLSLALAMLGGRLVWGAAMWAVMLSRGGEFTFQAFLSGAFVKAVWAIVIHLAIIPPIVLGLRRAKLISRAQDTHA